MTRALSVPLLGLLCSLSLTPLANGATTVQTSDGSGLQSQTLLAGQTIDAGSVTVRVVGEALEVRFATSGGWELLEAHLWVGAELATMPQTRKGNPVVGNFPYASGNITGATSHTFLVPLASLGFVCPGPASYLVAAHAALRKPTLDGGYQTETGWAAGSRFVDRGSWATFFSVTVVCVETPPPPVDCDTETAFAYSPPASQGGCGTTFYELGDFQRWGWSLGPLSAGSYVFDIYAGAGQNDITKGALVGTLTVTYTGSSATVVYDVLPGVVIEQAHLYVGSEPLPRDKRGEYTVAPGQYPHIKDGLAEGTTSVTFQVTGLSGQVYVVAHAVTCSSAQQ